MRKFTEPFWWTMFGAGGAMSALFLPVLIFLTCIAFPLGWIESPSFDSLQKWFSFLLVRLVVLVIVSLSLFHWAHRFRFTLYEGLQLQNYHKSIAIFCYGSAIVLSLFAVYVLI
jgi:fumarate reductase subunit D